MGLDLRGGQLIEGTFSPHNKDSRDDLFWSWTRVDMVESIWCCFTKMWDPGEGVITVLSENEGIREHGELVLRIRKPCECVPGDPVRNVGVGFLKGLSKLCEIVTPGGDEDKLIQSSIQEVLELWDTLKQEYGNQAAIHIS